MMIEPVEIILRLGSAALIGAAIGLNRDLHGKPIGVRTLALVGLASAVAILATTYAGTDPRVDAPSRVMQGVLTGVGFLGAGVIVRDSIKGRVHGLTTAASTWVTACLGLVCGVAAWPVAVIGVALAFVVLVLGGPFERIMHHWLGGERDVPPQPLPRPRDETQAQ